MNCSKCGCKLPCMDGNLLAIDFKLAVVALYNYEKLKEKINRLNEWELKFCTQCFEKFYQKLIEWMIY